VLEAQDLYEKAVRSAHTQGFVHNEAIANERAGCFYATRGFNRIATTYLRDAHYCYSSWGADGKVRQLEERYPELKVNGQPSEGTATIQTPVEHLDLATVIKVSEAVAGEIVPEKLIDTIMRTAIEHAGAERGLLILPRGDDYCIEAEATTGRDGLTVVLRQARVTAAQLPDSVFQYVLRTKEVVLLHDASSQNPFAGDTYIHEHHARSVLCLPLLKQARLLGVLYLENGLTPHAFTPARMAVLKLLASVAAVSMENTRLYGDLQEREGRVRRLVDSNIIGIVIWDVDGRIVEANEAFLQLTGHTRADVVSGRMQWRDLTPIEWREADDQRLAELQTTGIARPYEKELFKCDGTRLPVLVGAAIYDGTQHEGVAFVVDLSDRQRAEEAARASERRYHEIQLELAHANRIATIGQLTASTAHEINQPLSGIITNASTCLRMLTADPPNTDGASETVRRTLRDANRAAEVVARLRALFGKREPVVEPVDLNELTQEVIALSLSELQKGGVTVRADPDNDLPLVMGDRVQLQQVILNLLLNARDAMSGVDDRPREVVIRTERRDDDCACLKVQDSGVGLDSLAVDRLFQSFYTTKHDGMGMGLSVSRSIIESHHGRLWATQNDGPGATFTFSIPCASESGAGGHDLQAIRSRSASDAQLTQPYLEETNTIVQ
jgi:PAS domain S-box-containing protein